MSGPYRQEEDPEKPTHEPLEAIEIIPSDEFGNEDDYETSFLTYYADGVMTYDSDGSRVEDIEKVIGPKALDNFGADEPDLVHVRNHNYRKDYEVLKVRNKYADLYPNSGEEYE